MHLPKNLINVSLWSLLYFKVFFSFLSNSLMTLQGRALLRQYLQEIGYTDTIIDVRSNRVRSLLGLQQVTFNGHLLLIF